MSGIADQQVDLEHIYPQQLKADVDSYLSDLAFNRAEHVEGLGEAMSYSLLAGGKRVRPVLALATAKALELDHLQYLPFAAALEMIHTYSLIHDDLPAMDDDDLRRGMPTCHRKFGENVAILAGDALYAEAIAHLLRHQQAQPECLLQTVQGLVTATGLQGMVGGQYIDVCDLIAPGPEGLRLLHSLKTGRLIEVSITGVLALVGHRHSDDLTEFAAELGVLFQIVDDILDVVGSDQQLGKTSGSDERHGKRTYVSEFGIDGARKLSSSSYSRAVEALNRAVPHGGEDLRSIAEFIYRRSS